MRVPARYAGRRVPSAGIVLLWFYFSERRQSEASPPGPYLQEMTWRFDNRKNPFLFRDTMLKLIHSDNLEYKELTKAGLMPIFANVINEFTVYQLIAQRRLYRDMHSPHRYCHHS